jgi:hypothetical protein
MKIKIGKELFSRELKPACVIDSLNCCLAVNHIDDELTFCPHYQGRFGETNKTALKYKSKDWGQTQVYFVWSHKIADSIATDGILGGILCNLSLNWMDVIKLPYSV